MLKNPVNTGVAGDISAKITGHLTFGNICDTLIIALKIIEAQVGTKWPLASPRAGLKTGRKKGGLDKWRTIQYDVRRRRNSAVQFFDNRIVLGMPKRVRELVWQHTEFSLRN